jgi:PTH2 family peptidyl-tRNA hydrolase
MKVFFDRSTWSGRDLYNGNKEFIMTIDQNMLDWINGEFTKIVLQANSEEELMTMHDTALFAGLPVALIVDNGHTEFHGVKTKTCIAIGPAKSEDIDKITGHLKLF